MIVNYLSYDSLKCYMKAYADMIKIMKWKYDKEKMLIIEILVKYNKYILTSRNGYFY